MLKYPAARYHATEGTRRVLNEEEDKALGPGWADSPAKVASKDPHAKANDGPSEDAVVAAVATETNPQKLAELLNAEQTRADGPRKAVVKAISKRVAEIEKPEQLPTEPGRPSHQPVPHPPDRPTHPIVEPPKPKPGTGR